MNMAMKNFSLILFASGSLMLFALAAQVPAYADDEGDGSKVTLCQVPPGNPENEHTIEVDESSVMAHLTEQPGDYYGACVPGKQVSTCVSLAQLTETLGNDKSDEQAKSDDEYKSRDDEQAKADDEYKSRDDDESQASTEREEASTALANGDEAGYETHESNAQAYDDQAKEHDDNGKEYEDQAKEYDDQGKECESKASDYDEEQANIDALQGNCTVIVAAGASGNTSNSPVAQTGVWVPANSDYVSNALSQSGGASSLISLISQNNGTTVANAVGDTTIQSYREIRGQ